MTRFQKFLVIATLALFAGCTKKTPDSPELGQGSTDAATHGLPSLSAPTTPGAGDTGSGSVIDSLKSGDNSSVSPSTSLPEPRKKAVGKKGKHRKGKKYSR